MTPALLPQTQIAALPGVLYETLAHPSDIEDTIPRRMVLASGFRGSSLRLPLSGMVYCEIATRTLDTRLRVIKAGTEGGQGSEEVPITCHGRKTLPSHAAKILRPATYLCQNSDSDIALC